MWADIRDACCAIEFRSKDDTLEVKADIVEEATAKQECASQYPALRILPQTATEAEKHRLQKVMRTFINKSVAGFGVVFISFPESKQQKNPVLFKLDHHLRVIILENEHESNQMMCCTNQKLFRSTWCAFRWNRARKGAHKSNSNLRRRSECQLGPVAHVTTEKPLKIGIEYIMGVMKGSRIAQEFPSIQLTEEDLNACVALKVREAPYPLILMFESVENRDWFFEPINILMFSAGLRKTELAR